METQELTLLATVHQQAIARHDQEMGEIRATLAAVNNTLDRLAQQQAFSAQRMDRIEDQLAHIDNQQEANTQQIARLTENLLQLGNFIADDIRRRQS